MNKDEINPLVRIAVALESIAANVEALTKPPSVGLHEWGSFVTKPGSVEFRAIGEPPVAKSNFCDVVK